jgi:hypothetical protein
MLTTLKQLEEKIAAATGAHRGLDADLHDAVYGGRPEQTPPYTSSVDACLALIHERLPGWHWHIGYDPRGIFPYAVLTHNPDDDDSRSEMAAPTVPLALLGAFVKALRQEDSRKGT